VQAKLFKLKSSWPAVFLWAGLLLGILRYPAEGQTSAVPTRQLPFAAALQVAEQAIEAANSQGRIPDNFQLRYDDGQTEQLSAAQAFGLLAAAGESLRQGKVAALPLFPSAIGTPTIASGAAAPRKVTLFATSAILNQARGVLEFTQAMGAFPSAIWIGAERIPAGDYLISLAAIIRFTAGNLALPDQVQVLPYRAPGTWIVRPKNPVSAAIPPLPPAPVAPVSPPAENRPLPSPTLEIFPKEGAKLSGQINIVAAFSPAELSANVTISLDGRPLLHSNWPPFVFSLDTAGLTLGEHKIKVEAIDGAGKLLASREIKVLVESPQKTPGGYEEALESPD